MIIINIAYHKFNNNTLFVLLLQRIFMNHSQSFSKLYMNDVFASFCIFFVSILNTLLVYSCDLVLMEFNNVGFYMVDLLKGRLELA